MNGLINIFWNAGEKRLRSGLRILLTMSLFFFIYKGYLFLLNSVGVKLFYSRETSLWVFLVAGTVRFLPAVAVLWLGGRFIDRRNIRDFGLHFNKSWWIDFCFGLGLGAVLMTMIFITEIALGWISISHVFYSINSQSTFILPLLTFLFFFFCQGTFEEMLSRGYLMKNLAEGLNLKSIGPKAATLCSWLLISLMFGLAHLGNPSASALGVISLILIGLTLGAGFILTGELAIPIGLHVSWNFFQENVFGFPVSGTAYPSEIVSIIRTHQGGPENWTGGGFGPEGGLLAILANLLGFFLILLWVHIRRGRRFGEIHSPIADAPEYRRISRRKQL
jgi:membrane protease YdiL (CAAX protease family)